MKRIFGFCLMVVGLLYLASALPQHAVAHEGATGIIKERMDEFSRARAQLKQLRRATMAHDFDVVAKITDDMAGWAQRMGDTFPEGSNMAPSEAADNIWTDSSGFASAISRYQEAIGQLNKVALAQDRDTLVPAFQQVGAACKACHMQFRK